MERLILTYTIKEVEPMDKWFSSDSESTESFMEKIKRDITEDVKRIKMIPYGYDGGFTIKLLGERLETNEELESRIKAEELKDEKEKIKKLSRQEKALKKLLETFESSEEIMDVFKRLGNK